MRGESAGANVRAKIFWSDAEKAKVVRRAREIQAERPDMAGLPLLREAMGVLHVSRRRKVIALSQASWFDVMLRAEVKLAEFDRQLNDPLLKVASHSNEKIAELASIANGLDVILKRRGQMEEQWLALFTQLLVEVRALNELLGGGERRTAGGISDNPSLARIRTRAGTRA